MYTAPSSGDIIRNSTDLAGRATAKGRWDQIFASDVGLRCWACVVVRPLRVECAGAILAHVTGRGIARQKVVIDYVSRDKWIELLLRSVEQHGWRAFAFALLTNHYRRFLQTPERSVDALHRDFVDLLPKSQVANWIDREPG